MPTVETMIKKASGKVGALAITDHNTLRGYEHAKSIKTDLILIPGTEITASNSDSKSKRCRSNGSMIPNPK